MLLIGRVSEEALIVVLVLLLLLLFPLRSFGR
jgi:hypothetical protein